MFEVGEFFSGALESVGDFFEDAGDWIELNPVAAQLVGGVAVGAANGYSRNQELKQTQKLADQRRDDNKLNVTKGNYVGRSDQGIGIHGLLASADDYQRRS